jgi:dienelactone hydrolase
MYKILPVVLALLALVGCTATVAPAPKESAEAAQQAELLHAMPELLVPVAPTRMTARTRGQIRFDSSTPGDFDVLLADPDRTPTSGLATLRLPGHASAWRKVPAVVLLHGSGGIAQGREPDYAHALASRGIAALVVDYYGARGTGPEYPYMARVLSVTEFDVVADAYGALRALSAHPAIDSERIVLVGFSYGGMATRIAMDTRVRARLAPESAGFAGFVDFYGTCFQDFGTRQTNLAPLLTLRGTEDRSNDLAACAKREGELRALGVDVEAHIYDGAGHAWETHQPRGKVQAPYVAGCEVVYGEAGNATVNGRPYSVLPLAATRNERIANRARGHAALQACVHYDGYIVGRDDATKARSDAALDAFLDRIFFPPPVEPPPAELGESDMLPGASLLP